MTPLAAFLRRSSTVLFVIGGCDCGLWVADWCVALGWPDPAAPVRGRYHTAPGLARMLRRTRGLEALAADCFTRAGVPEATARAPGRIVLADTVAGPTLGLVGDTGRLVFKGAPVGLVFVDAPVRRIWDPTCRS